MEQKTNLPVKERHVFIDAARGISIILVVLWHAFGEELFYNGPLVFLRMPLFFFMAGLFATSVMTTPLKTVIRDKAGQLLWIFVIWSWILYLSRSGLKQVATTGSLDPYPLYSMFWDPPPTMWFVYALAIAYVLARITAGIPRFYVFAASVLLYCWSASYGNWADPPFEIKIWRLLPAFLAAVYFSDRIIAVVKSHYRLWPAAFALFAVSAYFLYYSELAKIGPLTAIVSVVGIFALLSLCFWSRETAFVRWMAWFGERSIYVYVMHRIVLTYLDEVAGVTGLAQAWPVQLAIFVLAVVIPPTIGKWVLDRFMPWLIRAPWLKSRRRTAGAPVAATNSAAS